MAKSISKTRKRRGRGRPFIGAIPIQVRMPPPELAALDSWINKQDGTPTRPEAIRRLVEMALSGAAGGRGPNKASARKAADLAGSKLDDLADKSLPADAQAMAKRRLLEGPKEFRGIRRDQKAKR
jgi:hypothetical protein